MTFDPFGDFSERGYLRNEVGSKDPEIIRKLEAICFANNLESALKTLRGKSTLSYGDILATHRTLFSDLYPWAGQDRATTAPTIAISKAGFSDLFAHPQDAQRAGHHALSLGSDPGTMRSKPGEVLGYLAYAHPFLDGNGRTIMTVHTDLCRRAGIHIDWSNSEKAPYLSALTRELQDPGKGHLDKYLEPFVREGSLSLDASSNALLRNRGLHPLLAACFEEAAIPPADSHSPNSPRRVISRRRRDGGDGPGLN